jgi:hypothetical protein
VEAYPIKRWGAYAEYRGTAAMFAREGFRVVAPLGENNIVMRTNVRQRIRSRRKANSGVR